MIYSDN